MNGGVRERGKKQVEGKGRKDERKKTIRRGEERRENG